VLTITITTTNDNTHAHARVGIDRGGKRRRVREWCRCEACGQKHWSDESCPTEDDDNECPSEATDVYMSDTEVRVGATSKLVSPPQPIAHNTSCENLVSPPQPITHNTSRENLVSPPQPITHTYIA
jgi:hypothetical protein